MRDLTHEFEPASRTDSIPITDMAQSHWLTQRAMLALQKARAQSGAPAIADYPEPSFDGTLEPSSIAPPSRRPPLLRSRSPRPAQIRFAIVFFGQQDC